MIRQKSREVSSNFERCVIEGNLYFLAREPDGIRLIVKGEAAKKFAVAHAGEFLSCERNVENAYMLMEYIKGTSENLFSQP